MREATDIPEANPLVSICIPAYNNASTIMDTVASVLASDYRHLEVVVVDDASSDDTYGLLETIDDDRVRVYRNDSNLGMAGNWNRCLSLCRGKYVRLLCADDRIDDDLISTEVAVLEAIPSIVMVSTDTAFIDESGKVVGHYDRYKKTRGAIGYILYFLRGEPNVNEIYDESNRVSGKRIVRHSIFTRDYLGAPLANLFRRELAGEFDPAFSYIIDYDFFVDLALKGDVYILHEKKNYFMLRHGSNTASVLGGDGSGDYVSEHRLLVEKYATALGLNTFEKWLSVMIRRITVFMGGIYLRLRG